MLIGYGFPKIYRADTGKDEETICICHGLNYILVVSPSAVQTWSAGLNRVRLSQVIRSEEDVAAEGTNIAAFWCQSRSTLAVLTSSHIIHVYAIHVYDHALPPGPSMLARDVPRVDLYLRTSIKLDLQSRATTMSGDSRFILVGCEDGSVAALAWSGKVREVSTLIAPEDASTLPSNSSSYQDLQQQQQTPAAAATGSFSFMAGNLSFPHPSSPACPSITDMHYCERSRALVLVLADGSVALCSSTGEAGPLDGMALSHWVVVPPGRHATCARIGWMAQMVAVGCTNGEVALYRLHRPGVSSSSNQLSPPTADTPVRVLSLDPWGHRVQQTGGVAKVEWSPDGRALAVGHQRKGLSVWSPSGCRLMCSLRQPRGPAQAASLPGQAASFPAQQPPGLAGRSSSVSSALGGPFLAGAAAAAAAVSVGDGEEAGASEGDLTTAASLLPRSESHSLLESPVTGSVLGLLGYQLLVAEADHRQLVEVQFARTLPNYHRVAHAGVLSGGQPGAEELHIMQAHDRLLIIGEALGPAPSAFSSYAAPFSSGGGVPNPGQGQAAAEQLQVNDLTVSHVAVPLSYLAPHWPLVHTAVSPNGMDIAVAARKGLALYSRASNRWRLFGDVSQERQVSCQALCWLRSIVVCCSGHGDTPTPGRLGTRGTSSGIGGPCELLFFPRHHLDMTSLLCRHPLPQAPMAMDCVGNHLLLATEPLEIALFEVEIKGQLGPSGNAKASLQLIREISMLDVGRPLLNMALVVPCPADKQHAVGEASAAAAAPRQCVLLRCGGLMSVLDLERGSEVALSTEVECFWLSDNLPSETRAAPPAAEAAGDAGAEVPRLKVDIGDTSVSDVEMPWWAYGPQGMQLWFPSSMSSPLSPSQSGAQNLDIELEFDQEVYPIGISLADASIVGITQRVTRTSGGGLGSGSAPFAASSSPGLPCLHPVPESQPVLPCLLRRLLQRGAFAEATSLARRHENGPHFMRSLEWLLFTTLEMESSNKQGKRVNGVPSTPGGPQQILRQPHSPHTPTSADPLMLRPQPLTPNGGSSSPLLSQPVSPLLSSAAALVRQFPQYADVVVSVARKTDAQLWPPLFSALGAPSVLLEGMLQAGAMASAACFLLVIDRLEGAEVAHTQAFRLILMALQRAEYGLVGDLLRFIMPPGEMERENSRGLEGGPSAGGDAAEAADREAAGAGAAAAAQQQQQQQQTSWMGWLFGGLGTAAPPAAAAAAAGSAARAAREMRTASRNNSMEMLQQQQQQASDRGHNTSPTRAVSNGCGSPGDLASAADARQAISEHAWQLLEAGHLQALARLQATVQFLPGGGLRQLMEEGRSSSEYGRGCRRQVATAEELLSALAIVVQELPAWSSREVEAEAVELCSLLQALLGPAADWSLALAVVLVDTAEVQAFREAQPQAWADFRDLVLGDPSCSYLHGIINLLDAEQGPGPHDGKDLHASLYSALPMLALSPGAGAQRAGI